MPTQRLRWHARRTGTQLMLTIFAIVLASCGGSDAGGAAGGAGQAAPDAKASAAIDPCELVPRADVDAALGIAATKVERPAEANIAPALATCRYTAPRGQGLAVLTVRVRSGQSDEESRIGFQTAKDQFADAQTVPGIGTEAFWIGDQLNVLQGKAYLIIGGVELEQAQPLARKALEQLGR